MYANVSVRNMLKSGMSVSYKDDAKSFVERLRSSLASDEAKLSNAEKALGEWREQIAAVRNFIALVEGGLPAIPSLEAAASLESAFNGRSLTGEGIPGRKITHKKTGASHNDEAAQTASSSDLLRDIAARVLAKVDASMPQVKLISEMALDRDFAKVVSSNPRELARKAIERGAKSGRFVEFPGKRFWLAERGAPKE